PFISRIPVFSADYSCISFTRTKTKISSVLIGLLVASSNIMWVCSNSYGIIIGLSHAWISQTFWENVFAIVLASLATKIFFSSSVIRGTVIVPIIISIDKYHFRTIFMPRIGYLHQIPSLSIGIASIMFFKFTL